MAAAAVAFEPELPVKFTGSSRCVLMTCEVHTRADKSMEGAFQERFTMEIRPSQGYIMGTGGRYQWQEWH